MVELVDGGMNWLVGTGRFDCFAGIGGLLCNPPFLRGGARKSGRLDVEVEERQEEVQKERESAVDWTLRWRRGGRKSKRSEKEWKIGR